MSAAKQLFDLQQSQQAHDEHFHKDIWCLPIDDRMKHMVLHFSKYTGRFVQAKEKQDMALFARTVIDTCIITLASANMLNINLPKALAPENEDIASLSILAKQILELYPSTNSPYDLAIFNLGKITGYMAKACESQDHMERFDVRGSLEQATIEIAKLSLALSSSLGIDLVPLVYQRWAEVERKSIFAPR